MTEEEKEAFFVIDINAPLEETHKKFMSVMSEEGKQDFTFEKFLSFLEKDYLFDNDKKFIIGYTNEKLNEMRDNFENFLMQGYYVKDNVVYDSNDEIVNNDKIDGLDDFIITNNLLLDGVKNYDKKNKI